MTNKKKINQSIQPLGKVLDFTSSERSDQHAILYSFDHRSFTGMSVASTGVRVSSGPQGMPKTGCSVA